MGFLKREMFSILMNPAASLTVFLVKAYATSQGVNQSMAVVRKRFPSLYLGMGPTTLRSHCLKGPRVSNGSTDLGDLSLWAFLKITQTSKQLRIFQPNCCRKTCIFMIL